MTYTALTRPGALAAASLLCLALGGCGESAEDTAKAQVCNARADISKQINTLGGLTLSSGSVNTAKASFEALGNDLKKIKDAQPKLDPKRKAQVESATRSFEDKVRTIASGLASNLSPTSAEAQFKAALSELSTAYKQSLAPIQCA